MTASPPPARLHMTRSEWGMLLFLSAIWGGSFFFIGVAVKDIPPLLLVFGRVCLAAVALNLFIRSRGLSLPGLRQWRAWRVLAGMAIFNNLIPFCMISWAEGTIESGLASILNATTPLFAVLVAHFFTTHEKLSPLRVAGVALGLFGVVVLMGGGAMESHPAGALLAQMACIVASISYAFSGLLLKELKATGMAPIVMATGQVTTASVILLPVALLVSPPWAVPTPALSSLAAVASLALLSTAFAYNLYFRILTRAGATNATLVTFLVPVSAILLGFLFLGERLHTNHFIGMTIIAFGLLAIDGRAWHWAKAKVAG